MAVEELVTEAVDPGAPLAHLAVGHGGKVIAQARSEHAHDVLDGIEGNAANKKKVPAHECVSSNCAQTMNGILSRIAMIGSVPCCVKPYACPRR
ncbi:MAG: hypothetical protein A2W04_07695 [Betaproteobacteria bacterium RBG_16_64_9]|nr:MAG: hypothetical protein A2W04_07695 [Betaproteobacteria bacterium RBG_16_64_9]